MDSQKVCKLVKNHTISFRQRRQKAPAGRKTTAGAEGMRSLFSKQRGGQIAVAGVGQKDDDVLTGVLGALCQLDGSPDGSAGGDAHQHALLVADETAHSKGVLVFHGDDLVVDLGVQHVGHKAGADALNFMCTGGALAQDGGGGRLDGHDLDAGVLALEVLAHAGHSAAGADAGHEDVHLAVRVVPDLRAGGGDVGLGVGRVDELAGDEGVGDLFRQLIGLGDGTLHALCALAEHQLCAVGLHQLAALDAHGLGHHDDDAVALGGGHSGQTDASVAGGRLDDDGAGLQLAGGLGVIDHGFGDAVLDGTGGVEVFQLCQQLGGKVFVLLDVGQLQQRGVADQLVCGSIDLAHNSKPLYCGRCARLHRPGRCRLDVPFIPVKPRWFVGLTVL